MPMDVGLMVGNRRSSVDDCACSLYQVVDAQGDEFRERAEEGGGLPQFVTKEVDEYLACGTPSSWMVLS